MGRFGGIVAALSACALALPAAVWAEALPGAPDLVPLLPQTIDADQRAPVFVDAHRFPGRILYRFDSVIFNDGGTLDVFRDAQTRQLVQAVWPNGHPSIPPTPHDAPPWREATLLDLAMAGATLTYVDSYGHHHWHFDHAARYELVLPDGSLRVSDKVGFCLMDNYGEPRYFAELDAAGKPVGWCRPGAKAAQFVRMGISPDTGDWYYAQLQEQWVDVTGLAPGRYVLRATVNPRGILNETSYDNNVLEQARVVPGVVAAGVVAAPSPRQQTINLSAEVVAPEIPGRIHIGCIPEPHEEECYVRNAATAPLRFRIHTPPKRGTVRLVTTGRATAAAVYTPTSGGPDSFTYTATDSRGLTSLPATVAIGTAAVSLAAVERPQPAPRARLHLHEEVTGSANHDDEGRRR